MEESIESRLAILLNAVQDLPAREDINAFVVVVEQAQDRGYFYPDEDEEIRAVYLRYLSIRQNLWELLAEIQLELKRLDTKHHIDYIGLFTLAFACGFVLMRAAHYLVEISESYPDIRSKLDEAEPLYGIEWGSFSEIYHKMRSAKTMLPFRQAVRFYHQHQQEIQALAQESPAWSQLLIIFKQDEGLLSQTKLDYIKRRLVYRQFQRKAQKNIIYSKAMYLVFKSTGMRIADLKDPTVKANLTKRVTADIRQQAAQLLQPGDYIITRHDDAMSNLFLPGFWPHAALYIGTDEQRAELGIEPLTEDLNDINILEAKKDGVKLRNLNETLSVDAFVILRPTFADNERKEALQRALQHRGKKYDFLFDFRIPQRLVCTEVIYRGFHGVAGIEFKLSQRSGRYCLSAEELLNQSLASGKFTPIAIYGVPHNQLIKQSNQVREILKESYESQWNNESP